MVAGDVAGFAGGEDAVDVDLGVFVVIDEELQATGRARRAASISRRSQMSAVFQVVPTTAPGVPLVPKPPGPCFQRLSSKLGLLQSAAGFSNVNRQVDRLALRGRHDLGDRRRRRARRPNCRPLPGRGSPISSKSPGSSSILMNTPPITGRARMPSLLRCR